VTVDRATLDALDRDELIAEALKFAVPRPEVMTRVELTDEILRLATPNPVERKRVRGWFGVARELVASVIEQGLHLPDAAALVRGDVRFEPLRPSHGPVATVTLAGIYAAQGHVARALGMLDDVLKVEPDHGVAQTLRDRLTRAHASGAPEASVDLATLRPVDSESGDPLRAFEPESDALPTVLPEPPADAPAPPSFATMSEFAPDFDSVLVPDSDADPDSDSDVDSSPGFSAEVDDDPTLRPPTNGAAQGQVHERHGDREVIDDRDDPLTLRPSAADSVAARVDGASSVDREPDTAPRERRPSLDGDSAILVRPAPTRALVYFEAEPRGTGSSVVLAVEWRLHGGAVERVEHEAAIGGTSGVVAFDGIDASAVVRAALGVRRDGKFVATAVASELRLHDEGHDVVWVPRRFLPRPAVTERSLGPLFAAIR
jgi:hypothetical protein